MSILMLRSGMHCTATTTKGRRGRVHLRETCSQQCCCLCLLHVSTGHTNIPVLTLTC